MTTIKEDKLEAIRKIALIRATANTPVQTKESTQSEDELMAMDDEYIPVLNFKLQK